MIKDEWFIIICFNDALLVELSALLTSNHEVAGSIPGKCTLKMFLSALGLHGLMRKIRYLRDLKVSHLIKIVDGAYF